MSVAENGFRKIKKASAQQVLKKHLPKRSWDICLELQAFIASHAAGNHFGLNDGETPGTMLSQARPLMFPSSRDMGCVTGSSPETGVSQARKTSLLWADTWGQALTLARPFQPRS